MSSDDLFVPDEPVADVLAAYNAGEQGVTVTPSYFYADTTFGRLVMQSQSFIGRPTFRGEPMTPVFLP